MPQETVCSKKFNPSMIFVPPLDIAPPSRAISWPNFWRSLPLKERTRDCGPRSLEQLAARGSCSRDSCLLRFGNLGREHGLETAAEMGPSGVRAKVWAYLYCLRDGKISRRNSGDSAPPVAQ